MKFPAAAKHRLAVFLCLALFLASCSRPEPPADPAPPEPLPESQAAETPRYAIITKAKGNPYMRAMFEGFQSACRELGAEAVLLEPDSYTADAQIALIRQATAEKVRAIAIAANHSDALEESLGAAMAAGICVVSLDSSVNPQSRITHIQQADPEKVGRVLIQAANAMIGGEGEAVIITSTPYATNQNIWLDWMKREYTENPEQYGGFLLLDDRYGEDAAEKTREETLLLLEQYPELKIIITPSAVSMKAVGEVLREQESPVLFTGLGLPSEIAEYIEDGSCPWMYLWNPIDIGYLAAWSANALDTGSITGAEGDAFIAGRIGQRVVMPSSDGGTEILLGDPIKFGKDNIGEWKLIY